MLSNSGTRQTVLPWADEPRIEEVPFIRHRDIVERSRKPRLEKIRALINYRDIDFDELIHLFLTWALYVEYLIFRRDHMYTEEKQYIAVKSAKRGNDVYSYRTQRRFEGLEKLPDVVFFDVKDRSLIHSTRMLFITLTYRRDISLYNAWKRRVSEDWNRFITGLRKRYGKINYVRVFESQRDGFPHIHVILIFEEREFTAFHHRSGWRIREKYELMRNWGWGFSDVRAMYSFRGGLRYLKKYLTKDIAGEIEVDGDLDVDEVFRVVKGSERAYRRVLTVALLWIFRKRSFSISGGIRDFIVSVSADGRRGSLIQVDLDGSPVWRWVLVGFWPGVIGEGQWSVSLSRVQYFEIRRCQGFSMRFEHDAREYN